MVSRICVCGRKTASSPFHSTLVSPQKLILNTRANILGLLKKPLLISLAALFDSPTDMSTKVVLLKFTLPTVPRRPSLMKWMKKSEKCDSDMEKSEKRNLETEMTKEETELRNEMREMEFLKITFTTYEGK